MRGAKASTGVVRRADPTLLDRLDLSLPAVLLACVVGAAQVKVLWSESMVEDAVVESKDPVYEPDLSHLPAIPKPGVPIFDLAPSWDREPVVSAVEGASEQPLRQSPRATFAEPDFSRGSGVRAGD